MMKVVVDASVAAKWFLPEIHSDAAARLLDPAIALYAPDLIVPEFGNILWKKIRRRKSHPSKPERSSVLSEHSRWNSVLHQLFLLPRSSSPSNSIGASTTVCISR